MSSESAEAFAEPFEEDWEPDFAESLESVLAEPLESALVVLLWSFCSAWVAADEAESPEPEPLTEKEQAPRLTDRARAAVPARTILGRRMMGPLRNHVGELYTKYNTGRLSPHRRRSVAELRRGPR